MEKTKWITKVDKLIQHYFQSVLRHIQENERQNVPLNEIQRFNTNIPYYKEVYRNAREEIFSLFSKIGIVPLAVFPTTMVHSFGLSSGVIPEFHHIETDQEMKIIISRPAKDLLEKYEHYCSTYTDPLIIANKMKDYTAHTASGAGATRTQIILPDISMFSNTISACKEAGIKTVFYPTIGSYHIKRFIDEAYWNVFAENEDLLLVSMYKFNNHKEYGEIFQVVLDQIPSIDRYKIVQRFETMCCSAYLPRLHSVLGNNNFVPNW
jgi:hypothetical protein